MRDTRGITLISLIVIIIILLILAGVTIAILTGDNGILIKANTARYKTEEATAKEKLQLELMALGIDKQEGKNYNKNEYLNNKLKQKGFIVENNDIIIVDNYCFKIDRDKLEIIEIMGKSEKNIFLSYSVYDNQDITNLKVELKFYNEKGITSIKKPDGTIIEKEGEKEVYIDYVVNSNTDENFVVVLKDGTQIECNLKITEEGIKETFKIGNYEIQENEEENEFTNITIDYENKEDTDKIYYKIGENGEWYSYTDTIKLDMAAIEQATDTTGNKGSANIYIKKEDSNGNIVTIQKEVPINSTAYNVLSNIRYKGESTEKYFTSTMDYNQFGVGVINDSYLITDLGYGHWEGSGTYGAIYKLDYSKLELKTANKIKVSFNHGTYNYNDIVNTSIKVYYTDGSSSEEVATEFEFNESWIVSRLYGKQE